MSVEAAPLNYYGKWLPTPLIEKITVYDEKITTQVSIKVGNLDYESPTELVDYMTNNLNFYVMWGMSELQHEEFIGGNINVLSMMSSSAELQEASFVAFANVSTQGAYANFIKLDFSESEAVEDWFDSETLLYKLTTEVDIQLAGFAHADLTPIKWYFGSSGVDELFLFDYYIDDYKNFFLYAFSSVIEKDEESYLNNISDTYNKIHTDRAISEMSVSDTSYEHVFKDAVLNDEPRSVFIGDETAPDLIYNDIPIQGVDGFYYLQKTLTFSDIDAALINFYTPFESNADDESISSEKTEIIESVKYIHAAHGRKPELLVQLNRLRKTWPIKTPGTSMGTLYRTYTNMISRLNKSLHVKDRLTKQLIYNNKILDRRSNASMEAATWAEVNTSFFGSANIPTAEARGSYTGEDAEYPYTGFAVDTEYEHHVIYNNYFMHRVGVNLNDIEVDDVSDVITSGFEDVLNKGYYFIDYERIVNDYLLISRVYYVKGVESIFGKAFTNSLINEKTLSLTRYNSEIDIGGFAWGAGSDKPIKEFWVTFDEDYSYPKVKYMTHQNLAWDTSDAGESPTGHAVLETDYKFSIDSEADGHYIEELAEDNNMVYSYVIPRNFDVLNTTNFYDSYDNYRLLCMSFEDYYSWEWASDIGREKEGGYFQIDEEISTEYYHTVFHIEDHSIAAVIKLIEGFLEIFEDFEEYGEYAKEACSYNSIDDTFNSFFVQAMLARFGDTEAAPWFLAPLIFNIHREMLYFTFAGSKADLILNTNSLMSMTSPESGNLEAITFLLEGMRAIADLYAGVSSLTSDEEVEEGTIAAFINEWGTDPIDMQFEGILECFPPIIYTADIVTTLGGDPTIEEDPPEDGTIGTEGGTGRFGGFGGTDKFGDDELFDILDIKDIPSEKEEEWDEDFEEGDDGEGPSAPGGI